MEGTNIYRCTEKENIGHEMQFLKQINQLLQQPLNAVDFIKTESNIREKEL